MEDSYFYRFNAYAKKLLRHTASNAHKARRRKKRQLDAERFSDLPDEEVERLSFEDDYGLDRQTFSACGRDIEINDADLSAALCRLPKAQREVLLLSACYDLADAEIAELLSVPRSTVQYRRTAAISYLQTVLEGHK